jgi:hypothetical protein
LFDERGQSSSLVLNHFIILKETVSSKKLNQTFSYTLTDEMYSGLFVSFVHLWILNGQPFYVAVKFDACLVELCEKLSDVYAYPLDMTPLPSRSEDHSWLSRLVHRTGVFSKLNYLNVKHD